MTPLDRDRAMSTLGPTPLRPSPYLPRRADVSREDAPVSRHTVTGSVDQTTAGVEDDLRLSFLDAWLADTQSGQDPGDVQQSVATKFSLILAPVVDRVEELVSGPSIHSLDRIALSSNLLNRLHFENNAWRLLAAAYGPSPPEPLQPRPVSDLVGSLTGCSNVVGDPASPHSRLDYCRIILEWLESIARNELSRSGGPVLKPFNDPAYSWDQTSKLCASGTAHMDRPLAADVDLDLIERQAEERVTLATYLYVRAGQLDVAQDICRNLGQYWRAASLGGAVASPGGDGIFGSSRAHWRVVAKSIARGAAKKMTTWEKAVYGVLCGEVEPVIAVSTTFEDRVWARLSALVDSAMNASTEEEDTNFAPALGVKHEVTESDVLSVLVAAAFGENEDDLVGLTKRMVVTLGLGASMGVQARTFIWKSMERISRVSDGSVSPVEAWALRFASHVGLFLRQALQGDDGSTVNTVLKRYCLYLSSLGRQEAEISVTTGTASKQGIFNVIARYAASLTNDDKVDIYANVMKDALYADVRGPSQFASRHVWSLEEAGGCFADRDTLNHLVERTVDRIFDECLRKKGTLPPAMASHENLAVMKSLNFLTFPSYPHLSEAVIRINEACRIFTLRRETDACRHLLDDIDKASVIDLVQASQEADGHELQCWLMYREALEKHHQWDSVFRKQRPLPPSEKVREQSLADPDQIAYEVQAAANVEVQAYHERLRDYDVKSQRLRCEAVDALKAALQGRWMHDTVDDLSEIRSIGVPTMVALLHSILHESACHVEAMQVADLVASESLGLYADYSGEELQGLLDSLQQSSVLAMQGQIQEGHVEPPYKGTFFEACTE